MSVSERAGHDADPLGLSDGFDAKSVAHRFSESLFATEIALCCLDGHMAQQELDLFQFTSSRVTESSA